MQNRMRLPKLDRVLLAVVLVVFGAVAVDTYATPTTFTDRASWEAAAGTFTLEDFDSFTSDLVFHDGGSVDAGAFVLTGFGNAVALGETFNRIDAAPFSTFLGSLNGTTDLAARVYDFDGTQVGFEIVFEAPVSAWGCDWGRVANSFRVSVDGVFLGVANENGFFGFVDDDRAYTRIRIDTGSDWGGAITAMDDFVFRGCEIDQAQPNHPVGIAAFNFTDLAQSFSPERSVICGASVKLREGFGTSGDVTIELWDRLPNDNGHLLRSGTATGALHGTWVSVAWPSLAIDVTQQYFLVFRSDSDLATDGATNNPYPGGICYANPGYQPFPSLDYAFKTFAERCEVDVSQPDDSSGCYSAGTLGNYAQSFTPTVGVIRGARFKLTPGRGGLGDFTIELWDDLPQLGGTLLASGTDTDADGDAGDWATAEWPPVRVTVGERYFLFVNSTDASHCVSGTAFDSYPGGDLWTWDIGRQLAFDLAFETLACELECHAGNVDQTGEIVLTVNGEHSADGGWVPVPVDGPLTASIVKPSAGGNGKFLVHANWGAPTSSTVVSLPGQIGSPCFDLLIVAGGGSATPAAIWNNIGKTDKVGSSTGLDGSPILDPSRAPVDFLSLPTGDGTNLPVGTLLTLQGVIVDPNTGANKPVSLTNAVVVSIQ